jgi:glycine/D-amino acid oxidase-like deaminating enzyme
MAAPVLIVGQGLAGTALGLACAEAGLDFVVADPGSAGAASRVAAGLVNPVAGQRWTVAEDFGRLAPPAEAAYRRWGRRLGADLWQPLALRRRWRDDAERAAVRARLERGDFGPYAGRADETGLEIRGAARVDLPLLLDRAAAAWGATGRLRRRAVERDDLACDAAGPRWCGERFSAVVLCAGAAPLARAFLAGVPVVPATGEVLVVGGSGLAADEARLDDRWLVGEGGGRARVGATFERGGEHTDATPSARAALLEAAERLAGRGVTVLEQLAGVRLTTPDRRPIGGWLPGCPGVGMLGALGSKGVLRAPDLAFRWVEALRGAPGVWPAELAADRWRRADGRG